MKPQFTPNRPICDGDTGSVQRPSKDKSSIWQACEKMAQERLEWVAHHHERMAWRSAALVVIQQRVDAGLTSPEKPDLGDAELFRKEATKYVKRRQKPESSCWTPRV